MSSCRTETLDVTGAYCKKLRSELAAHSNLGSLSAAAPRSPGYRDPAKPLSSYDRDLDANDAKSRRISSSARAGIRRASRVVQLRNPIHGEPENGDSKAIIQAMTETRKKGDYPTIIRPRITCGLHRMRTKTQLVVPMKKELRTAQVT